MDFREATNFRIEASQEFGIQANLNRIAFLGSLGVVLSLTLALRTPLLLWRALSLAAAGFCLLGTFLPQSRSAVLAALTGCVSVLFLFRRSFSRVFLVAAIVAACAFVVLPKAVFARYKTADSMETGESGDSRVRLYGAVLQAIPSTPLTGVGAGRYPSWAGQHGLVSATGHVVGAHNSFAQVFFYWGIGGLGLFLALLWSAFRCLPRNAASDPVAAALVGLAAASLVRLVFSHTYYEKDFAVVLGLLLGAKAFLWPTGDARQVLSVAAGPDAGMGGSLR
jgi:hypothetical protein